MLRLVGFLIMLGACVTWAERIDEVVSDPTCFEFPVVIITISKEALPAQECMKGPFPGRECMKRSVDADVRVVDRLESGRSNCLNSTATSQYTARVHYRGQSSLFFEKHQFAVNLMQDAEFLGFPPERNFVLNGPVIDASLIRNHLAHWMFRATGRYSPRTRHIVLFVQDLGMPAPEYLGIYLALEKITYGRNRVALAALNNACSREEFSGGWAWQRNPLSFGVYSPNVIVDQYQLMFDNGERPVLMHPKAEDMTQSMRDYFVDTATGPLPLLYRYLFHNISQLDDLEKYVDLGSFADYFLHTELSQNTDAYSKSAYFFKDRDQPINAGPVWDLNLAYGLGINKMEWFFTSQMLWRRLVCNYKFVAITIRRWRELRATAWSDDAIADFIDNATTPIFRQLNHCKDWRSKELQCAYVNTRGSYDDHVQDLRNAVLDRAQWMDENIVKLYAKLESAIWNPASQCPVYNCARDGNGAGCLDDPEKYIDAIEFPAPRKPYAGPPCTVKPGVVLEKVTIDPCWMSAGIDFADASVTPFCSGNGYCKQGPGATCECVRGFQPPACGNMNVGDEVQHVGSAAAPHTNRWRDELVLVGVAAIGSLLLVTMLIRQRPRYHPRERTRLMAVEGVVPPQGTQDAGTSYGT